MAVLFSFVFLLETEDLGNSYTTHYFVFYTGYYIALKIKKLIINTRNTFLIIYDRGAFSSTKDSSVTLVCKRLKRQNKVRSGRGYVYT